MRRYKSSTLVAMADAALLTAKMSDVQALLFVSLRSSCFELFGGWPRVRAPYPVLLFGSHRPLRRCALDSEPV